MVQFRSKAPHCWVLSLTDLDHLLVEWVPIGYTERASCPKGVQKSGTASSWLSGSLLMFVETYKNQPKFLDVNSLFFKIHFTASGCVLLWVCLQGIFCQGPTISETNKLISSTTSYSDREMIPARHSVLLISCVLNFFLQWSSRPKDVLPAKKCFLDYTELQSTFTEACIENNLKE